MTMVLIDDPGFYHCEEDEECFFWWLKRMPAFDSVKGTSKGLEVYLKGEIDRDSLYKLIGLMSRYDLDMRPLRELSHPEIEEWFKNKRWYWHEDIFGDESKAPNDGVV